MFDRFQVIFLAVLTALSAIGIKLLELVPVLIVLYIVWRVLVRHAQV